MTAREFNRVIRSMGRTALEFEAGLARVYERAMESAGRYLAQQFDSQAVTAAADWIPPTGAPPFDSERAMLSAQEQREQAARAIEDAFRRGVADFAISFDPRDFTVFSDDLLTSLGQHAGANFDASARDTLSATIRQSFDQGLSVPDTARAIRSHFGEVSRSTATMLARTDLIGLANGGAFIGARAVFQDQAVEKKWINAHDARVRPSHVAANDQQVPMDAPFRVGGFDLMYPGDPQGPPQEVIQCRCTFVVEDGAVSASAGTNTGEMATQEATGTRWRSVLVLEGVETDDGRLIDPGALDWRELPLTLMAMQVTGPGGHEGAEVSGRIDTITRNDRTGEVIGEGVFDSGEFGQEIQRQVGEEILRGVSVDLAIREFELRGSDGQPLPEDADPFTEERIIFAITDASIMGATVCPFPAFADASIELLASAEERPPNRARFTFGPITLLAAGEGSPSGEMALEEGEQGLADANLGEILRRVYSDTVTMESTSRGYHFTAQVPVATFEAIYRDLSQGAGALAEQMLAVGARPPISLAEIGSLASVREGSDAVATFDMAATLRQQNETILAGLNEGHTAAAAAEEFGVADVLSKRIERHQRWAVQLRGIMAA